MQIYKITFPFSVNTEQDIHEYYCPTLTAVKETIAVMTKDDHEVSATFPLLSGIIRVESMTVDRLDKLFLCRLLNGVPRDEPLEGKLGVVQNYQFLPGKRLRKIKVSSSS